MGNSVINPTKACQDLGVVLLLFGINLVISVSLSVCIWTCVHRALVRCWWLHLSQALRKFLLAHPQPQKGHVISEPPLGKCPLAGGSHLSYILCLTFQGRCFPSGALFEKAYVGGLKCAHQ